MASPIVTHTHVSCDKSGLSPLTGVRYKKIGANFDLCEAEFKKLPVAEHVEYVAVSQPQSNAQVKQHFGLEHVRHQWMNVPICHRISRVSRGMRR